MRLLALISLLVFPGVAGAEGLDERRAKCLGWMMSGYPSGLEETSCTAQFSLPSPFLFKCVRARRVGFDTALQRKACSDYLARASEDAAESYIRTH